MTEFSRYIKRNSLSYKLGRLAADLFFAFVRKAVIIPKRNHDRILIISLHKLGDTVFTVPAIKAVKIKYGGRITVVCFEESKQIYQLVFDDLDYIVLKKDQFYIDGRIASSKIKKRINELGADYIIDLTGAINSASLIFNSKARRIAGFNDEYFRKIYTDYIPRRSLPHLMDLYLDAVKLIIKVEDEEGLKHFGKSLNKDGYIVIHPFAGWKSKEWDFNKFIELYLILKETYRCKLILPANRMNEEMISELKIKNVSVFLSKKITDLINIIKESSIVVGCDTGAVYIASLLGKPTMTIYGPTNPRYSLPYGDHHEYIYKENKNTPKYDEQYGIGDAGRKADKIDFMESISVDEVKNRIDSFYNKLFNN